MITRTAGDWDDLNIEYVNFARFLYHFTYSIPVLRIQNKPSTEVGFYRINQILTIIISPIVM